jgi:hypothetical protein
MGIYDTRDDTLALSIASITLGERAHIPTEEEVGRYPELVCVLWRREKFLASRGN